MRPIRAPRLALLTLAHFTVDAYSSFLSPLLPLVMRRLSLSLTQVGMLVALASLSSSLSQPLFGWFSDRLRRPWFVALGPLVAAVFLSSVGAAPTFGVLIALLLVGGLGSAAFHPQGAVLAGEVGEQRGVALSLFVSGGTLGFALGPLFAVAIVTRFGLEHTAIAAIPGLFVSIATIAWFRRVAPRARSSAARPGFAGLRPVARPLVLLYLAVVFRSAVSVGYATFLSVFLNAHGFSVAQGGAVLAAFLASGAVGGLVGGMLAERWGGRRVVLLSFALSLPLYLAFLALPIGPALGCLFLGSFFAQSALPVNVVMGQQLSPAHASTISSLLMGAAWGLGALMVGPVGAIADRFGLSTGLLALTSFLAAGVVVAWLLPRSPLAEAMKVSSQQPVQMTQGM